MVRVVVPLAASSATHRVSVIVRSRRPVVTAIAAAAAAAVPMLVAVAVAVLVLVLLLGVGVTIRLTESKRAVAGHRSHSCGWPAVCSGAWSRWAC